MLSQEKKRMRGRSRLKEVDSRVFLQFFTSLDGEGERERSRKAGANASHERIISSASDLRSSFRTRTGLCVRDPCCCKTWIIGSYSLRIRILCEELQRKYRQA